MRESRSSRGKTEINFESIRAATSPRVTNEEEEEDEFSPMLCLPPSPPPPVTSSSSFFINLNRHLRPEHTGSHASQLLIIVTFVAVTTIDVQHFR